MFSSFHPIFIVAELLQKLSADGGAVSACVDFVGDAPAR